MYSYIKGELVKRTDDYIVVDNNGIGYEITCPIAISSKFGGLGETVTCWVYQSVREDDISLFGFSAPEEKDMFLLLITVNGVGPKLAHAVCSQMDPDRFALVVLGGDVKTLTSVKGLGKKGAEKIILELKDKFKALGKSADDIVVSVPSSSNANVSSVANDAVEALMVLGYKQEDAASVVSSSYEDGISLQELIRKSLKSLAR